MNKTQEDPRTVEIARAFPRFTTGAARRIAVRAHGHANPHKSAAEERVYIDRLTVNYLRHRWTSYDELLRMYPEVADQRIIHARILEYIVNLFPPLRNEAIHQIDTKPWPESRLYFS